MSSITAPVSLFYGAVSVVSATTSCKHVSVMLETKQDELNMSDKIVQHILMNDESCISMSILQIKRKTSILH